LCFLVLGSYGFRVLVFYVKAEPANSKNKSDRNLSIKVLGKKVVDINTDDVIEVDGEDTNSEDS
jgi:hypothetical protein